MKKLFALMTTAFFASAGIQHAYANDGNLTLVKATGPCSAIPLGNYPVRGSALTLNGQTIYYLTFLIQPAKQPLQYLEQVISPNNVLNTYDSVLLGGAAFPQGTWSGSIGSPCCAALVVGSAQSPFVLTTPTSAGTCQLFIYGTLVFDA